MNNCLSLFYSSHPSSSSHLSTATLSSLVASPQLLQHPPVMATIADQANSLLDFNKKLDIELLDNVVNCMYRGQGPQVSELLFAFGYNFVAHSSSGVSHV